VLVKDLRLGRAVDAEAEDAEFNPGTARPPGGDQVQAPGFDGFNLLAAETVGTLH
jgi:hypothetical protein